VSVIASKRVLPGRVRSIPSARRLGAETRVRPRWRGSRCVCSLPQYGSRLHSRTKQIADFRACIWRSDSKLETIKDSRPAVHRSCASLMQRCPKMHHFLGGASIKDAKRETKRESWITTTSPERSISQTFACAYLLALAAISRNYAHV